MPLSEKVRIEVYIPDSLNVTYYRLLQALNQEFTYAFGGATIIRGLEGSFLSRSGTVLSDRIALLYTDAPLRLDADQDAIATFSAAVHAAVISALEEEAVLVAVHSVLHVD